MKVRIMTNRDRILQTNEYDLLLHAQKILDEHKVNILCILTLFGEQDVSKRCSGLCELCIERWMNEEAKPCRKLNG
jgi:hypothetical protein